MKPVPASPSPLSARSFLNPLEGMSSLCLLIRPCLRGEPLRRTGAPMTARGEKASHGCTSTKEAAACKRWIMEESPSSMPTCHSTSRQASLIDSQAGVSGAADGSIIHYLTVSLSTCGGGDSVSSCMYVHGPWAVGREGTFAKTPLRHSSC